MAITSKNIISLSHAQAKLSDLCEEVRARGDETLIMKNGNICAVLIGADRLDHYHRLEREHIHIGILEEAIQGVADLNAKNAQFGPDQVTAWPVNVDLIRHNRIGPYQASSTSLLRYSAHYLM